MPSQTFVIDSVDRDTSKYPSAGSFVVDLPYPLYDVCESRLDMCHMNMPSTTMIALEIDELNTSVTSGDSPMAYAFFYVNPTFLKKDGAFVHEHRPPLKKLSKLTVTLRNNRTGAIVDPGDWRMELRFEHSHLKKEKINVIG